MDDDGRRLGAVVLGIDGFELLDAAEVDGEVWLHAQTTAARVGCPDCGVVATLHDRRTVAVRDLAIAGRATRLLWNKRVWRCDIPVCPRRTWTEQHPEVAPRAAATERVRREICFQVGKLARPVAVLAREYGLGWEATMNAVRDFGTPLVDDPDRILGVAALGVDESAFQRACATRHTTYVTGMVDLDRGRLLDVVRGRTGTAVKNWLAERTPQWRDGVRLVALDPHRGYFHALVAGIGHPVTVVVDHFHTDKLGNAMVDDVRRRVQNHVMGHRGRKGDPLYSVRRLLLRAADRLTARGWQRLENAWDAGDDADQVYLAWVVKETLRDVYAAPTRHDAHEALQDFYRWATDSDLPEAERLARTVAVWEREILAWHTTGGASNGRTEAINLLVKKVKRTGHGFRNFDNYRLRLLLHCGVDWHDAPTARIRGRAPRSAA